MCFCLGTTEACPSYAENLAIWNSFFAPLDPLLFDSEIQKKSRGLGLRATCNGLASSPEGSRSNSIIL